MKIEKGDHSVNQIIMTRHQSNGKEMRKRSPIHNAVLNDFLLIVEGLLPREMQRNNRTKRREEIPKDEIETEAQREEDHDNSSIWSVIVWNADG